MIDTESIKKANLFRVIYIGLCFLVLFTSYIAAQNMIAQIYTQLGYGSLGQVCLFLVFGFMGLTSVIAPYLKKKLSVKAGLIYGALPHISLIFAGALTTFCDKYSIEGGFCASSFIVFLNCVCAASAGIGAAILWLCQALYVNDCAQESTKGIYNGLFWSIFQSAQIVSGILATLILGSADQFTFYLILLVFGFISIVMISFIKDPLSYDGKQKPEEKQETLSEALSTFGQVLTERRYYVLYHGLLFSGIAIGCYIGFLNIVVTQIVDSTDINVVNSSLGLVLLFLAIGEVSAGLSAGRVADMFDKFKVFNATMMVNEAALLMTLLALLFKSYPFAIICGFLWGYGDTSIQTLINAVIGSIFGGRIELYSAYKFFQGFACMYSCLFCAVLPSKEIPLLYITFIAGSLLIFHTLYLRHLSGKQAQKSEALLAEEKLMVELKNI